MILEFPTNLQIPTYKYVKGSLKPSHSKCNYSFSLYLFKSSKSREKGRFIPKNSIYSLKWKLLKRYFLFLFKLELK